MIKLTLRTAVALFMISTPALAQSQAWNVTEESAAGVKGAQGTWTVVMDGSNKITGSASLQTVKGAMLTYNLDGSVKDNVYTINLTNRSDDKKGCVWTGSVRGDAAANKLAGDAVCDGAAKMIIRAGH
jgi:hypothetical protein